MSFLLLVSVLLELPVPVVQGADLPGLQPPGDAVEVEGVVTHPPGHRALLAGGARLVKLKIPAVHSVHFKSLYLPGWPGTRCRGP